MMPRTRRRGTWLSGLAAIAMLTSGCGLSSTDTPASTVTLQNCGKDAEFPTPAREIYVYDGSMIAMVLALGAEDQIAGIAGIQDDRDVLAAAYGTEVVDDLPVATDDYPTLENVIATQPDLMIAGWNYGFSEERNLVPDQLTERGITPYILTESCRQADTTERGIAPPWEALRTDMTNLGKITARQSEARDYLADLDKRLGNLQAAEQAADPPTVFLFDSGSKQPFSSGSFGGPEAIISAAGGVNALTDLDDTWTTVSWERVVAKQPDAIAFVDYPGQTFEEKVKVLETNPATRELRAVRERRYLNLPYATWTSGPLNIDAAEHLRVALEAWDLVPQSDIEPPFSVTP